MNIQKVLLVENEENIQVIVQMALEGTTKWNILLASSGIEALEKAKAEKPDLILLDIMMPVMDGKTTFNKLQEGEDTASIPVIFMTAKVQRAELDSYLGLGAAGVIQKPFDPMKLSSEILQILDKHDRS